MCSPTSVSDCDDNEDNKDDNRRRNLNSHLYVLTVNCIRYRALPLVHNGGFHVTFPPDFLNYLYTICIYTNHNHISGKKKYKIFVPFQNGGQITDFDFASFRFRPKFEKKHFPKGIFQ